MSFGVALSTGRSVADVEAWPENVGKVTADDVLAAARHVLKDTGSVTAILLGAEKKTTLRKAAVAPGSEPNEAPDGMDGPDGPGEAPGAGQPN
jgi:zinc protease